MSTGIRLVAENYDMETGQILKEAVIHNKEVQDPVTMEQLGYSHAEQIDILEKSQDFMLGKQAELINSDGVCPVCGKKHYKKGRFTSVFHALFTDHKVIIQRRGCGCGWQSAYTVEGIYGSSLHPDLVERQSLLGADHSFQKAAGIMNYDSSTKRAVNNDDRIKRTVSLVGTQAEEIKSGQEWADSAKSSGELILVVDGGHIKCKDKSKQSFEALIATIYNPSNIKEIDKNHRKITNKTSVASAKKDDHASIKKLVLNACKKQGIGNETTVTALSDGASNCWSIIDTITPFCKEVVRILDWFHIGKKFKNTEHCIPKDLLELFEKGKWHLWHGHPETSLQRLDQVYNLLKDDKAKEKLEKLITYVKNNAPNIVNYHARRLNGLPYTSNLAECSVNSLINSRQKRTQKMQWTRDGANAILQIRTSVFSGNWDKDWGKIVAKIYKTKD